MGTLSWSFNSLGYFEFSQSHHNMSLTQYADTYTGTVFQGSLPDWSGLDEALAWLNKPSPLVGFTDEFIRLYPHLCAADAFVPVGKVCTCSDAVKSPRETERLRRILDDAQRLNYIPALRVNYRQYGLDDETAEYVKSMK